MTLDSLSNSGYQVGAASYSWTHICAGAARYLVVAVSVLANAGTVVTGVTYNGVVGVLLGTQDSDVPFAPFRVELWGLANPAAGAHAVEVSLNASFVSIGGAVSFNGVPEAAATAGFAGATALNVGAADATVDVVTPVDGAYVVGVVATDDVAITIGAGCVAAWNQTGGSGSGAGAFAGPATPSGTVPITWTNVGAGANWVVAGVAVLPLAGRIPNLTGQVCV